MRPGPLLEDLAGAILDGTPPQSIQRRARLYERTLHRRIPWRQGWDSILPPEPVDALRGTMSRSPEIVISTAEGTAPVTSRAVATIGPVPGPTI